MPYIAWKSKITGHEGRGPNCLTYSQALGEVESANKRWPEINHWVSIEPVEQELIDMRFDEMEQGYATGDAEAVAKSQEALKNLLSAAPSTNQIEGV